MILLDVIIVESQSKTIKLWTLLHLESISFVFSLFSLLDDVIYQGKPIDMFWKWNKIFHVLIKMEIKDIRSFLLWERESYQETAYQLTTHQAKSHPLGQKEEKQCYLKILLQHVSSQRGIYKKDFKYEIIKRILLFKFSRNLRFE